MRFNDATIIACPRFVKQGKEICAFDKNHAAENIFAHVERRKGGRAKEKGTRKRSLFAKISYLPPKIRLPSPVEVKNRMSMTTGTTYFIITL